MKRENERNGLFDRHRKKDVLRNMVQEMSSSSKE